MADVIRTQTYQVLMEEMQEKVELELTEAAAEAAAVMVVAAVPVDMVQRLVPLVEVPDKSSLRLSCLTVCHPLQLQLAQVEKGKQRRQMELMADQVHSEVM